MKLTASRIHKLKKKIKTWKIWWSRSMFGFSHYTDTSMFEVLVQRVLPVNLFTLDKHWSRTVVVEADGYCSAEKLGISIVAAAEKCDEKTLYVSATTGMKRGKLLSAEDDKAAGLVILF